MSYPTNLTDPQSLKDLLNRKEFNQYKIPKKEYKRTWLDDLIRKEHNIMLMAHQRFVRNLINPNTKYNRLLIKHATGTGKTIAALGIAQEFINQYQKLYDLQDPNKFGTDSNIKTPHVFIIGFSKHVFQKELLRHPEFGFVSKTELIDHKRLKILAESGTSVDKAALAEFETRIKKRITNRHLGGFYKFYGYKEFFNRMFIGANIEDLDQDSIHTAIAEGKVKVNFELVEKFANSIVICDEIHNTYNSSEANNYGIALMTLFDIFDGYPVGNPPQHIMDLAKSSLLRVILMSATPLNNSPTEIVDLLSLLVPRSQRQLKKTGEKETTTELTKDDLFYDTRTLKPGAMDTIKNLLLGKISFIQDVNPKYFPEIIWEGTELRYSDGEGGGKEKKKQQKQLPYLKFIRCPMSKLHYKTYKEVYEGTLPPDGQALIDLVLPNPKEDDLPLFRTRDIKSSLQNAPQIWKDKNKIDFLKQPLVGSKLESWIVTGDFMKLPQLSLYSAKYAKVVEDLIANTKINAGKVMIIHQYVKNSGVLFLQEVLRRNGFIDEFSHPVDNTLCSICAIPLAKHPKPFITNQAQKTGETVETKTNKNHQFMPAKFIMAHGDVDKNIMNKSIEKYDSGDNSMGHKFKVLIGSKMIKEAYDFKDVRHEWVIYPPSNIATLIQIFGRSSRTNSHINLPPELRQVYRRIYVSSIPGESPIGEKSYEELKYIEKMKDHLIIQDILATFNSIAIDADIHREIIFPQGDKYHKEENTLESKYFEVSNLVKINKANTHTHAPTFDVFHRDDEIKNIQFIIKRLFIEKFVYKYKDLWRDVQNPYFYYPSNTRMFTEENFKKALLRLLFIPNSVDIVKSTSNLVDSLFDEDEKRIIKSDGGEYRIIYKSGFYILAPIIYPQASPLGIPAVQFPELYEDCWIRSYEKVSKLDLPITDYLKTSNVTYETMKYKFYNKYRKFSVTQLPASVELYGFEFHLRLIEECIRYAFNILTNASMMFSELHEFYFKMLYFYSRLDIVLFANNLTDVGMKNYEQYVTKEKIKIKRPKGDGKKAKVEILEEDHKYNSFLMTSMLNATGSQEPFNIHRLNDLLEKSRTATGVKADTELSARSEILDLTITKELKKTTMKRTPVKVFASMLPVGHFLTPGSGVSIPKIYNPEEDTWSMSPEFTAKNKIENTVENQIIIGYYERTPGGIDVKFKIRQPKQLQKEHQDARMLERGNVCSTKKKEYLIELATKLEIKDISPTITNICDLIKLELMDREMKERRKIKHMTPEQQKKHKQTRWFYLHFEN